MSIAVSNILRMTSYFMNGVNEALMVSFWQVDTITDPAPNVIVAQAFQTLQMASNRVGGLISAGAKATRTVMDNLSSPLEFGDFVGDNLGSDGAAQVCSDFTAILVKQTRFNRATRNGYKRVPFPTEASVNGNVLNISTPVRAGVEAWFGVEAHLSGTFSGETIDVRLVPIIVGRTLVGGSYEIDLTRLNPVTGASIVRPTTQNSRKA